MTTSVQDIPPNGRPTPQREVVDATNQPEKTAIPSSVQDIAPRNDRSTPEHEIADAPKQADAPSLDVAFAIMRALHGDRIPDGALGPDNVPAAVLDLPIAIATEDLVRHAKRCQNLNCPHVPQPLRAYRRMRPDAIRSAKEQVYRALWTHPNHELVAMVRKQILDNHSKLADEISTGKVLNGERLAKTLVRELRW